MRDATRSSVAMLAGAGLMLVLPLWAVTVIAVGLWLFAYGLDRAIRRYARRGMTRLVLRNGYGERWEYWASDTDWHSITIPGVVVDAIGRRATRR
jgi:hypothetical protein